MWRDKRSSTPARSMSFNARTNARTHIAHENKPETHDMLSRYRYAGLALALALACVFVVPNATSSQRLQHCSGDC